MREPRDVAFLVLGVALVVVSGALWCLRFVSVQRDVGQLRSDFSSCLADAEGQFRARTERAIREARPRLQGEAKVAGDSMQKQTIILLNHVGKMAGQLRAAQEVAGGALEEANAALVEANTALRRLETSRRKEPGGPSK